MAAPIAFEPPSIQKAWQAFLQHIPVVLVSWVGSIVLSLLSVLAYALIIIVVAAVIGSSDPALGLGMVLAQLVQLPLALLASLLSVLLVAVPALYYERGEVVTISAAAQLLTDRWWRYVLAGLFFSLVTTIGFLLCILPGIAVALVTPVFVNRIFVTDMTIGEAFAHSFQVVYRSENGLSFVGLEVLTGLVVGLLALLTCGLGGFVVIPMASFFLQNVAYQRGLLR
jgi:hypothetical protein